MIVDLVRIPCNFCDAEAVAVRAQGSDRRDGYVNKAIAVRPVKLFDEGDDLIAIRLAGDARGHNTCSRISILAESTAVVTNLPSGAASRH